VISPALPLFGGTVEPEPPNAALRILKCVDIACDAKASSFNVPTRFKDIETSPAVPVFSCVFSADADPVPPNAQFVQRQLEMDPTTIKIPFF